MFKSATSWLYNRFNVFYFPLLTVFTSRSFCLTTAFGLVNDGNGALDGTPKAFYLTKTLIFQEPKSKISLLSLNESENKPYRRHCSDDPLQTNLCVKFFLKAYLRAFSTTTHSWMMTHYGLFLDRAEPGWWVLHLPFILRVNWSQSQPVRKNPSIERATEAILASKKWSRNQLEGFQFWDLP